MRSQAGKSARDQYHSRVGDDARRNRIYLPLDEIERFGVKAADLLNARYVDGFVPLMRFQAERARAMY
jgi:phytoene synthase